MNAKLNFVVGVLFTCAYAGAGTVTPITVGQVPQSSPSSVFDINTHPSNLYGLGVGTTMNAGANFDVRDLFGGHYNTDPNEPGNAIFTDEYSGFVDTVLVSLPSPAQLKTYNLFLAEDPGDGDRSTSEFKLYAGNTLISDVQILSPAGGQTFTSVYGSNVVEVSDTLSNAPLTSSYTLEFVQNQSGGFGGVRADEFDAFVPEPGSIALGSIAILGMFLRRRQARISGLG